MLFEMVLTLITSTGISLSNFCFYVWDNITVIYDFFVLVVESSTWECSYTIFLRGIAETYGMFLVFLFHLVAAYLLLVLVGVFFDKIIDYARSSFKLNNKSSLSCKSFFSGFKFFK